MNAARHSGASTVWLEAERVTATRRLTCEIDSLRNRLAERGG